MKTGAYNPMRLSEASVRVTACVGSLSPKQALEWEHQQLGQAHNRMSEASASASSDAAERLSGCAETGVSLAPPQRALCAASSATALATERSTACADLERARRTAEGFAGDVFGCGRHLAGDVFDCGLPFAMAPLGIAGTPASCAFLPRRAACRFRRVATVTQPPLLGVVFSTDDAGEPGMSAGAPARVIFSISTGTTSGARAHGGAACGNAKVDD
mmetsp:Transcript_8057/g.18912  ORF Transcript_8057/g.18912 Transcript_8057/m.18912 type:complete len:216 (-) Transcript_8057:1683-2330(-)